MGRKNCRVSFTDADDVIHVVQVEAASLYEAAVLGLKALNRSDWIDVIGPYTRITVRVGPREHFVMFAQLNQWLERTSRSPEEELKKKRFKDLLDLS